MLFSYLLCIIAQVDDNGTYFYTQEVYICQKYLENTNFNLWQLYVQERAIPALFILSLVSLGLLVAHVWRTQRAKLFGWLMLSAIFMLFIFYLFTCLIKFVTPVQLTRFGCEISGLIIQFSYMSATLWLASMSFFMWKSFRRMASARTKMPAQATWGSQHPHFKWYALFSWGLPLTMTIVTLILQHGKKMFGENYIRPNIGDSQCFLGTKMSTLLYFHIINGPALVINLLL